MSARERRREKIELVEDVAHLERSDRILRTRNEVLRMLRRGVPLPEALKTLCLGVEGIVPGLLCSVLSLDRATKRLTTLAAPSLPEWYSRSVDGMEIGPNAGSCGRAAFTGELVVIEDVLCHPNWEGHREIARRAGFRACWSHPVIGMTGEVDGTFAMYYREPRTPEPWELELIETSAAVVSFALEHGRLTAGLAELRADVRAEFLRSQEQQAAIVELARHQALLSGDSEQAFRKIDEVVAATLRVERVSIWLLGRDGRELRCADLFERTPGLHSEGTLVLAEHYPRYFAALEKARVVDANDVCSDPRTNEFADDYLIPLHITSMLDAPIRVSGEVVGVVCHEHVGSPRTWRADEILFAGEVADQAAQAIVQSERKRADEALRESERAYRDLSRDLERRVVKRTRQLERANEELRSLASELLLAEERERRRLAVDLHDGLNQLLVLAQLKLAELRQSGRADAVARIGEIEDLVERANRSARTLTFQLSPPVLHDLGFVPAAQWLVEDLRNAYGIPITLEDDGREKDLDERMRVFLFRALRELLVNVGKHSGATRARVRTWCERGTVRVAVEDDGAGFDPAAVGLRGFGLASVRERLSQLGGQMRLDSAPGKGTRIELRVPLRGGKSGRGRRKTKR